MNDCLRLADALSTEAPLTPSMALHVRECPRCRAQVAAHQTLSAVLAPGPVPQLPPAFASVLARATTQAVVRRRRFPVMLEVAYWSLGIGALVAVLLSSGRISAPHLGAWALWLMPAGYAAFFLAPSAADSLRRAFWRLFAA